MSVSNPTRNATWIDVIAPALLAVVTIAVFLPVLQCGFVNYDDPIYVSENPRVQQGLSVESVRWAFTFSFANWIPLDTLSHMADCQFYGMNPKGHHATNLALHTLNVLALYLFLRMTTRAPVRSAFVAGLFALHPINAGTVAWIASRKDVLSTFFALLALIAYARYAAKPAITRYLLVTVLFVLALMSKPMVASLPLLFLAVDFWPLRRLSVETLKKSMLFVEKIPWLAVSAVFAAITYATQQASGSVMNTEWYPIGIRATNALVSTVMYLVKLVWPSGFTPFYPHPGSTLAVWQWVAALLLLLAVTVVAILAARKTPYLLAGWCWYLVALLPVSGLLVQLGGAAMADRYAYLPLIGVFAALVWGIGDAVASKRAAAWGVSVCAAGILCVFGILTAREAGYWRNSETLWTRALAVTRDNPIAQNLLGDVCLKGNKLDDAMAHFSEALRIAPQSYFAENNLGIVCGMRGQWPQAKEHFEAALKIKPDYAKAFSNLAKCRIEEDNLAEAARLYKEALRCMDSYDPDRAHIESILQRIAAMGVKSN